jgi:hypothetical protein
MSAALINPLPMPLTGDCLVCHCTEDDPCMVWNPGNLHIDPCAWVIPGVLCSNPKCLASELGQELMGGLEVAEPDRSYPLPGGGLFRVPPWDDEAA